MNLRQKVKQAKKELANAEEKYSVSSIFDIFHRHQARSRLQKIIDYKRKPNKFYNWDDEYEIDWDGLTFISLNADFIELLRLASPNGKPFSKEQVEIFIAESRNKIFQFGTKVQQRTPNGKNYVCYSLSVSNDYTKKKSLHQEKLYRQYDGNDILHPYND